jgi:hypothetical protein
MCIYMHLSRAEGRASPRIQNPMNNVCVENCEYDGPPYKYHVLDYSVTSHERCGILSFNHSELVEITVGSKFKPFLVKLYGS